MGAGILDLIVETKKKEVQRLLPQQEALEARAEEAPDAKDFSGALRRGGEVAVVAEVKRRSPGAGPIRPDLVPGDLAQGYEAHGAAAVSVLTDSEYFGGSLVDLEDVRRAVGIPIFRKDFILHWVQLLEARASGADGCLLIARILSDETLASLHGEALRLGMDPLVEVHDRNDLDRALGVGSRLLGVNNRNLQTFQTSLDVTLQLLEFIPSQVTVVSESGIHTPAEVDRLGRAGVHGVLVGESLLRADDPGRATAELVGRPRVARGDD
jgi:indole-3-glycerol phosphate synthase